MHCSSCGSNNITTGKRGLDLNKAATGGLLFGFSGSDDDVFICQNCGNKWTVQINSTNSTTTLTPLTRPSSDGTGCNIVQLWVWGIVFFILSPVILMIMKFIGFIFNILLTPIGLIFLIVCLILLVIFFLIKELATKLD
jgi:hypothetical protein